MLRKSVAWGWGWRVLRLPCAQNRAQYNGGDGAGLMTKAWPCLEPLADHWGRGRVAQAECSGLWCRVTCVRNCAWDPGCES